jgi:hypothetical protein
MNPVIRSQSVTTSSQYAETGVYQRHFHASHTLLLSNKFNVEIVFRPYNEPNADLDNELWTVLMRSCEKDEKDELQYKGKINIRKVAINVDYLILASVANHLVAFTSGSYVSDNIFYVNAAMVLPEYQASGLGGVLICLLALKPVILNLQRKIKTYLICRTQNRKAASILVNGCDNAKISTEPLDSDAEHVVEETVSFLHCGFESKSGITHDVYPEGLPKGYEIHDDRINHAFAALGPTDACYVLGLARMRVIAHLLKGRLFPNQHCILPST